MSEASSSARATPVDLPPSPPLPAPTTVSNRSLRPRRQRGRSSATSSVSPSRSRSQSRAGDVQPARPINATGHTNTGLKRRRSESSPAGGRHRIRRVNSPDDAPAAGSSFTSSSAADIGGADESVSYTTSSHSEPMSSSILATSNIDRLSDDGVEASELRADDSFANSSGTLHTPYHTSLDDGEPVPGRAECLASQIAGSHRALSPSINHSDDESPSSSSTGYNRQRNPSEAVPIQEGESLAAYTCPICFSAPSHATITPCGHVLCGECLFTAVKTSIQRGAYTLPYGERMIARCPVCRAPIPGWDGKGGGVIGLRPRAVFSL